METLSADAPEFDPSEGSDPSLIPNLNVEVATVSVADGIWQDQPDNVAAFVEARLGDLARGRGNLYICLDVSGEVEGRNDVERALVEVIRNTYAESRGSISFSLSEALRAANAHLFEANRQTARELRRMAGISAIVMRGNDLYIAQAGPAVVYVEASERLARYPTESDWFVEDAPLIAPQGTASAPLGIRREFASDLAHASISLGDVFVLGTRALTQLATTPDLAIAFTERSAQEICAYLEELGEDADITALVAEVMDPRPAGALPDDTVAGTVPDSHIESLPVPLHSLVPLDESEPPVPDEEEDADTVEDEEGAEPEPAFTWQGAPARAEEEAEQELNWDDEDIAEAGAETDAETSDEDFDETEPEPTAPPAPVYASAAAAIPMMSAPLYSAPRAAQPMPAPQIAAPDYQAEIERRRAERDAQRAARRAGINRAFGGIAGALLAMIAAFQGALEKTFGGIDWDGIGKSINRALNMGVSAVISFFLLLVRLVLPGSAIGSTKLLPRRATSDPIWLKALALVLPVLFIGLAAGRFMLEVQNQGARFTSLVAQADTVVKQAEINPDKTQARAQLSEALELIHEARDIRDTEQARAVLYRIQDQTNEIDGVAVLYFMPTLAQVDGAQFKQVVESDSDVFMLDGHGQVYAYLVNDASGSSKPAVGDGIILKPTAKVGNTTVSNLQLIAGTTRGQDTQSLIAVGDKALFLYDIEGNQWTSSPVEDTDQWGKLAAISAFGGNVYLLDSQNNQIYKYTPTANGYSANSTPYFPDNARPVLNKAVDMAIDGDVWILNDNGSVLRYRAGQAIPFELGQVPTPLQNPVAIYTNPDVDSLYIADAGNQRIVEFDKDGKFVRQFKPYSEKSDAFKNIQDFTVNATKRKLYFVNPDAAFMANLAK